MLRALPAQSRSAHINEHSPFFVLPFFRFHLFSFSPFLVFTFSRFYLFSFSPFLGFRFFVFPLFVFPEFGLRYSARAKYPGPSSVKNLRDSRRVHFHTARITPPADDRADCVSSTRKRPRYVSPAVARATFRKNENEGCWGSGGWTSAVRPPLLQHPTRCRGCPPKGLPRGCALKRPFPPTTPADDGQPASTV